MPRPSSHPPPWRTNCYEVEHYEIRTPAGSPLGIEPTLCDTIAWIRRQGRLRPWRVIRRQGCMVTGRWLAWVADDGRLVSNPYQPPPPVVAPPVAARRRGPFARLVAAARKLFRLGFSPNRI